MVCGYVAFKVMQHIDCETCCAALGNKDKNLHLSIFKETRKYIDELNRGGLTFPTDNLFNLIQCAYRIFNVCVSSNFENKFITIFNQNYTLISVIEHYISMNNDFAYMFSNCSVCHVKLFDIMWKALVCFSNILLNNYSSNRTNETICRNVSRKISKLI